MEHSAPAQDEFVVYQPPKSVGYGHGSKSRNARKAWWATEEFLSKHANAVNGPEIRLRVWEPSERTDAVISQQTMAEAIDTFGPPSSGDINEWKLPAAQLTQALDFAFRDEERPKQLSGPVALHFWYRFDWKHLLPVTRGIDARFLVLPPNFRCLLLISIGGRKFFAQPTFLFSLPSTSPKLARFLSELEPDLPFSLKDEYFYRVVPMRPGKKDRLFKLHQGWRHAT